MGRSMTPREQYYADKWLMKERGTSLRGPLIFTEVGTGSKERLDNHLAVDRYPELSFLFSQFDELFLKVKDDAEALSRLDQIEEEVKLCESEQIKEGTVYEWFVGKLDPRFYYADENNRLFYEYLIEQTGRAELQC